MVGSWGHVFWRVDGCLRCIRTWRGRAAVSQEDASPVVSGLYPDDLFNPNYLLRALPQQFGGGRAGWDMHM